jgi:hypothetical protein
VKAARVGCALAISYVVFAVPVLRSRSENDPLYKQFTDHIRHRFCANAVLHRPIHALTMPLYLLKEEFPTKHQPIYFPKEPCTQGGVVHVLFQAPFQWLIDHAGWEPWSTTNLHVLINLLLGHLWMFLVIMSKDHALAAVFLFPWMVRTSLMSVQAPLEALLGYLSFRAWMDGRKSLALALFSATFSAYNRFLIWIPAWGAAVLLERREVWADLKRVMAGWRGRIVGALAVASFAWSLYATLIVWGRRAPLPTNAAWMTIWGLVFTAVWLVHWVRRRDSVLALFAIVFGLFVASYRGFIETWYLAPLMALAPLGRTLGERLLWIASVGLFSDVILFDHDAWSIRYPMHWVFDSWTAVFK